MANILWSKSYGTALGRITAGGDSALYIAGNFTKTIQLGEFTLSPIGNNNFYVAKISDRSGTVLWAKQISSTSYVNISQLTCDSKGSVYVGGTAINTILSVDTISYDVLGYGIFFGKLWQNGSIRFFNSLPLDDSRYYNTINTISVDKQDNLHVFYSLFPQQPPDPFEPWIKNNRVWYDSLGVLKGMENNFKTGNRSQFRGYKAKDNPTDYVYTKTDIWLYNVETTWLSDCSSFVNDCYNFPPINPDYDKFGGTYYAGQFYVFNGVICPDPVPDPTLQFNCSNNILTKPQSDNDIYAMINGTLVSTKDNGRTNEYPGFLVADPNGQSLYILGSWAPPYGVDTSKFYFGNSILTTPGLMVLRYRVDRPIITVNAGEDKAICLGGTTSIGSSNIVANGTAPFTYNWSPTSGLSNSRVPNPTAKPDTTTHYIVTVIDAAGGVGRDTITVTVDSNLYRPTIALASGVNPFCEGDTITLKVSNANSYQWSNGATTQAIKVGTSDSIMVTAINAAGCIGTSLPYIAIMKSRTPTPTITANGPTAFCNGKSVVLTAQNSQTQILYQWSNGAETSSITITTPGVYSVKATGTNGCTSKAAQQQVMVYPLPMPVIIQSGNALTVSATAVSYQWYLNGTLINDATAQALTIKQGGSYRVVVTNSNGCSNTAFIAAIIRTITSEMDYQVYPNPVTNDLNIVYTLKQPVGVRIILKDMLGRNIITILEKQNQLPGEHKFTVKNASAHLQRGYYFVIFNVGDKQFVQKIIIM